MPHPACDNLPADDPDARLRAALRKIFGFYAFRPNQEPIVRSILARRDVFAVMPTGGGKSLCYQLPAWLLRGVTVVISPLISLMKDQVDAARDNGLAAELLNSSLTASERSRVLQQLRQGQVNLLYVSPERFAMADFLAALKAVKPVLFAVDEAHCISEWGHDFRPDYLGLARIVPEFPDAVVAAFTATATLPVQQDIIAKLALRDPLTVRASFDRPNLFYEVLPKSDDGDLQILDFLRARPEESGIVYRTTRSSVETTAAYLRQGAVKALPYHAGLDADTRQRHQDLFNRDEVNVIVATIAFGMGIDKSNVRFVIHGDLPKNMESYYQETGRAGRDGEPAHCLLLYSRRDIARLRYFINQITDDSEFRSANEKLQQMVDLASQHRCRRRQILGYFGQEMAGPSCGACDVCAGSPQPVDATTDGQILMSAIARTDQRWPLGHAVDIVLGSATDAVRQAGHQALKTFARGQDKPLEHWQWIADHLILQGCLARPGGAEGPAVLTAKGNDVLFGRRKFIVLGKASGAAPRAASASEVGRQELFERLRRCRLELARAHNVPPFVIFSDRTLAEMADQRPANRQELLEITGVGERKARAYGREFLKVIAQDTRGPGAPPRRQAAPSRSASRGPKRGSPSDQTAALLEKGHSIDEIAALSNLKSATIVGHVEQLLRAGRAVDLDRLMDPSRRRRLGELFAQMGAGSLRPVLEALGDETASYAEARLVRAEVLGRSAPSATGGETTP